MANVNDLAKVLTQKELSILETALSKYHTSTFTFVTGQSRQPCDILYGQIKAAKRASYVYNAGWVNNVYDYCPHCGAKMDLE